MPMKNLCPGRSFVEVSEADWLQDECWTRFGTRGPSLLPLLFTLQ